MLKKNNLKFLLYFFLLLFSCGLCGKSCIVISLPFDLESDIDKRIQDAVTQDFVVQGVDYTSDIAFEEKEFFYLIGFKVGDRVGVKELKKAIEIADAIKNSD